LTSQFKSPLPGKSQSANQKNDWLTAAPQPAAPSDQSQGSFSRIGRKPSESGLGLLQLPWKSMKTLEPHETPQPASLADRETLKQSSVPTPEPFPSRLPETPQTYVQSYHENYGRVSPEQRVPYAQTNEPSRTLPAPQGPKPTSPPTQFPGRPLGNGGIGGALPPALGPSPLGQLNPSASALGPSPLSQLNPSASALGPSPFGQLNPSASALGYKALNQGNPGTSFSMSGMGTMTTPRDPSTFSLQRSTTPLSDKPASGKKGGSPLPPNKNFGKKRKKKRKFPIWARVLVGFLLFLLLLGGAGFTYYQIYFADAINSITGQQVQRRAGEEDPNTKLNGDILSGPRINILLLGSDTDQKFQGSYIAQTDIVVTIDPATKSVGMLSIPRDFYINVPGYGMHKLDEAYGLGGVDLSRATIEQDFGIPINYYAWVGLDGFIKVINEVGGVDVDVMHPIVDDQYPDDVGSNANDPYALKRLYIAPGPQHLDGEPALEYVRSRHADLVGDFGRSARQQQVLGALKTKLSNPNIFGKLSAIANDLKGYLKTDMQLSDVLKLMNFARSLDINKISKLILGPPYSSSGNLPNGESVVFPNCDQLVPAIAQLLQLGNNAACNIQASNGQSSPVASTHYLTSQASPLTTTNLSGVQSLSNSATGTMNGFNDLFGIHSLLNLMFLGVFESPDVLQL
jgi:LCP family protein required for cell wall assembly